MRKPVLILFKELEDDELDSWIEYYNDEEIPFKIFSLFDYKLQDDER